MIKQMLLEAKEKRFTKNFYNQILTETKKELLVFNLRIYLRKIEIENIESFLRKIDNTKEQNEEADKLLEQKKQDLKKDEAEKINIQLRYVNINNFINELYEK